MEGTIITKRGGLPKLHDPILVVGLPGIGSVGKMAVDHIRAEFKAERIATLYSQHFPSQVMMTKKGGVRLVSNRFYLLKRQKGSKARDIVLLTGEYQALSPEGQFEVNKKITNFFKNELKGSFIYTIGGYMPNDGKPNSYRVFGNTTGNDVIDQFKGSKVVFGKSKGMIWGSAGLLIAFAKMQKIKGICLLGETTFMDFDVKATKAVLDVLSSSLHLKINTENLDKLIKQTNKLVASMQQMQPPEGSYVETPEDRERKLSYIR